MKVMKTELAPALNGKMSAEQASRNADRAIEAVLAKEAGS
jgi:hypothetical protein